MTLIVTIGLTIYAFTTEKDFTTYNSLCYIVMFALFGIVLSGFFVQSGFKSKIFSFFGVIVYGVYIIQDTQLIAGGKRN